MVTEMSWDEYQIKKKNHENRVNRFRAKSTENERCPKRVFQNQNTDSFESIKEA